MTNLPNEQPRGDQPGEQGRPEQGRPEQVRPERVRGEQPTTAYERSSYPQPGYGEPHGMPMAYGEPGLAPNRLIFSEKTDRAIGFLARVGAIYLIIGLVLLALMVVAMFTVGAGMYGMRGY